MDALKDNRAPLTGAARRALLTLTVFSVLYTVLSVFAAYYFPEALNEGRNPKLLRLGMFAAAICLFLVFALQARRDGSAPSWLRQELRMIARDPGFIALFLWFLWACIAMIPAVREGYSSFRLNSGYLFDQFVNFLILYPMGYFFARRRDDRMLTAMAAICFLGFLPYAVAAGVLASTKEPFTLLGRTIDYMDYSSLYQTVQRVGLGGNPNIGGFYGNLAFASGLFLLAKAPRRRLRVLLLPGLGIIAYAMILTGSRGAIGSAALALIYFAGILLLRRLPEGSMKKHRGVWIAGGTVLLLAVLAALGYILQKLSGRALVEHNAGDRFGIWQVVFRVVLGNRHILLHGVSSPVVSQAMGEISGMMYTNTHNQLLEAWVAQGTPALCLFVVFLCVLARRCLHVSLRLDRGEELGSWVAVLFVLALFANSMVEVILVDNLRAHGSVFGAAAGAVGGFMSLLPGKREARR